MTERQKEIIAKLENEGWRLRVYEGSRWLWPDFAPASDSNQGISLYEGSGDEEYDEPTVHGSIEDPETEGAVIQYLREYLGYN